MDKHLAMVDAILDGRDWILGQLSLAHFGMYGGLSPLLTVGKAIPRDYPDLSNWVEQTRALG